MFTPIKTEKLFDGTQDTYQFNNGHGASVIRHKYSYGGDNGLFELAVLDKDGLIDYDTPITNNVIGHLSDQDVQEILQKISEL
jgi:hypothetical protein